MKFGKRMPAILLLSVMLLSLCGCAAKEKTAAPEQPSAETGYSRVEDLAGKKIGVVTGSVYEQYAEKHIPDVKVVYYNSIPDLPMALNAGKIDGYIVDQPVMRILLTENPTHRYLGTLENDQYGFIFPKTEKGGTLRDQFNEFLAKTKEDGILAEIDDIWFGNDEGKKVVDLDSLTGENGTLQFATIPSVAPFTYVKDGQFVGYEIDLIARFCKEYGYSLDVSALNVSGMLASVSSGKSDLGGSCITINEERKKSMYFSEPDYIGGAVLVVKSNTQEEKESSGGIAESFAKTFLHEDRWKLFASGIGLTMLITVLSAVFGTMTGFLLYLVYRKKNKIFNGVLNFFMDILEKTPVVVILMILFYIIFGKSDLNGIWVAVIGFSILFACGFVRTVDVGVKAVDNGQTEASLALGFTETKTFLLVILPQAAKHFLPNYRGNIVSLLKDTAIVGYIAVQDLTQVSDIVRSQTYEPFFPLIATAIIYFLLAWMLTVIVGRIEWDFDPKNRSIRKILKEVQTK